MITVHLFYKINTKYGVISSFFKVSFPTLRTPAVIILSSSSMESTDLEYIIDLRSPNKKISHGVRFGKRGGQAIFPPLPIQLFEHLLLRQSPAWLE